MNALAITFVVFGYQLPAGGPAHAHTWLVATKGSETVTISWGPVGAVNLLGLAEPGRNMSHEETLRWAKRFGARVVQFGPYPMSEKLWLRAKMQKARLDSGVVAYKAVALVFGSRRANCIVAVAEIGGPFAGGLDYGHEASRRVALHLLSYDSRR